MLKNYLQTALRSLYRYRVSTVINIAGLSLAIASCIPFYLMIRHETSFDGFHDRADRIYRVVLDWSGRSDGGQVHFPAAQELRADFPDFEMVTQAVGPVSGKIAVDHPGEAPALFSEKYILYVDQNFLSTLDFKSITPITPATLSKPNEVLLTASLAERLFPGVDAVGRTITLNDLEELRVVGILEDPPINTNLPFRMLVSYATFERNNDHRHDWLFAGNVTVYITLRKGDKPEKFSERLKSFTERHVSFYEPGKYFYGLQPLRKVHTSRGYGWDAFYYAPPEIIWLPAFLGLLIIVISSINFVNLSMAHALTLAKETGVRKVVGSTRTHLVLRFLLQTSMVVFISMLIGLLGGYLLLRPVNELFAVVDYHLEIGLSTVFFLILLGFMILMAAGLYPALVLAHSRPAHIFRGNPDASNGGTSSFLRKGLLLMQIGASLILLVGSLVITSQIDSWRNKDLGFRRNSVVTFPVPAHNVRSKQLLRNSLSALPGIEDVSFSSESPFSGKFGSARVVGTKDYTDGSIFTIDEKFTGLYRLKYVAGRNLTERDSLAVLLNQKMSERLGFKQPADAVGSRLEIDIAFRDHTFGTTTGVIEDYLNSNPVNANTSPAVFLMIPHKTEKANVALAGHASPETLDQIRVAFRQLYPNEIFLPSWIADEIESSYELESMIKEGVGFISGLSILIGCIGTYGMVSFMGSRRRKEFSIRKTFGASRIDIVWIFVRDFSSVVIAGFLLGAPLAGWLLTEWLQQYKNHLNLDPAYFLQALVIMMVVTAAAVFHEAERSSRVNPAETLRGE